ncbi:MAG: hypothetical protein RIS45_805, partial [Planctomycetota bacterium]
MLWFALLSSGSLVGCGGGVAAPASDSAVAEPVGSAAGSPGDPAPPVVAQPAQLGPVHKLTVTDL